jgi:aminodeoxyfutalosine deaminase
VTGRPVAGERDTAAASSLPTLAPYPKIELHVHLEGAMRPRALREMARRNHVPLGELTDEGIESLYEFTDFAGFIAAWVRCSDAVRTGDDLRRLVVDYAEEAGGFGAAYVEAIISPAETVRRGASWDELFSGATDGVAEAQERHGVVVRLTPDIPRGFSQEEAEATVRTAARFRDRGVVAVGLGGLEKEYPPEPYAPAFRLARELGLGSVPHAGEVVGPASIRGALEALGADRLRHGIRAVEDPALMAELAERAIVLDVCLTSNIFTGAALSLADHPLPKLMAAGVLCTLNTDDPAFFRTDLENEHAAAARLGLSPRAFYEAGLAGALCDDGTRARLRSIGDTFDWAPAGSTDATDPAQPLTAPPVMPRTK